MEIDLMPAFRTACTAGVGGIVGKFTEMGSYQGAVAFAVTQVACEAFIHLVEKAEDKDWINIPNWASLGCALIVPAIGNALYLHQAKLASSLAQGALLAVGASLLSIGSFAFIDGVLELKIKLK